MVGVPVDTRGGNWFTGYTRHKSDWFVFATLDGPGRTGHNYANRWAEPDLIWQAKEGTTLHQPEIKGVLTVHPYAVGAEPRIYIFVRSDDRAPFVFVGCGWAKAFEDTTPVNVLWGLYDPHAPASEESEAPVSRAQIAAAPRLARETKLPGSGYGAKGTGADRLTSLLQKAEVAAARMGTEAAAPSSEQEGRERVIASIVRRRGQPAFRSTLILAYGCRCAITEANASEALEAAHIRPYNGAATNTAANGLLLRGDIHTLFDLGLVAVDANRMRILVSPKIEKTVYAELADRKLFLPRDPNARPSPEALEAHRVSAGL